MDHLSEQQIDEYRNRRLSPTQLIEADAHLASCDKCHLLWSEKRLNASELAAALYEDVVATDPAGDDHLNYESLEALVDQTAPEVDEEIAKVHLAGCQECAAELRALEEVRDQKPIYQTVRPSETSFFRLSWPSLAFATLALLFVAGISWWIWKQGKTGETQVAAVPSPTPVEVDSPVPSPSATPSPQIVVALKDGGATISLDSTGRIEGLGNASPAIQASVKAALTSERLNVDPSLAGLRGKDTTLMGSSVEGVPFRLRSPLGVVVLSDRPNFRWQSYPGANVYVVKVFDSDYKEIAQSLSQTATSWSIPLPLSRGGIYSWQVTAVKDGEEIKSPTAPAPEARFRVLNQNRLDEITKLQKMKPQSHLALGTVFAEAGLLEEARREFRLLLQANPESKVAQKLLQEVSR